MHILNYLNNLSSHDLEIVIISSIIAIFFIALILFLIFRFFWLWYWKINKRTKLMEEQNKLLKEIINEIRDSKN